MASILVPPILPRLSGFVDRFLSPNMGLLEVRLTARETDQVMFSEYIQLPVGCLMQHCSQCKYQIFSCLSIFGINNELGALENMTSRILSYAIQCYIHGPRNFGFHLVAELELGELQHFLVDQDFILSHRDEEEHAWVEFIDETIMWEEDHVTRNKGASKPFIESLKKFKIKKSGKDNKDDDEKVCCVVCLEGLGGDEVECCSIGCSHVFHYDCIVQWLKLNNTCPLCRFGVPIDDD